MVCNRIYQLSVKGWIWTVNGHSINITTILEDHVYPFSRDVSNSFSVTQDGLRSQGREMATLTLLVHPDLFYLREPQEKRKVRVTNLVLR